MKHAFILTLLLGASSSFAQEAASNPSNSVPETIQLAGRGIQAEDTEEVIFLACVDPENSCRRLRMVQLKPQKTPVWLGEEFPSENTIQVREDLKKWFKERRIDDIFTFLSSPNYSYAFTEKNGWSWSNNPLKLRKRDFSRVSSSLIYYATYHHAAESEKSMVATPKSDPALTSESLNQNFEKCYALKERSLQSNDAVDQCMKNSKQYQFFNNPSFDRCYELKAETLYSHAAVNECMKNTRQIDFNNNANFEKCYSLKERSLRSNTAVDQCMNNSKVYRFIENPTFDRCYELKAQSLYSDAAVNECMI